MANTFMMIPRTNTMWKFCEIGQCRKWEVKGHPVAPVYEEKMPFFDVGDSFGTIHIQKWMRLIFHAMIKLVF